MTEKEFKCLFKRPLSHCPAFSCLLFHVLQFHALQLRPFVSRPAFSVNPIGLAVLAKYADRRACDIRDKRKLHSALMNEYRRAINSLFRGVDKNVHSIYTLHSSNSNCWFYEVV